MDDRRAQWTDVKKPLLRPLKNACCCVEEMLADGCHSCVQEILTACCGVAIAALFPDGLVEILSI